MNDLISRQAAVEAIVNTVSRIGLHDNSEVARYGATFRQHEIIDIVENLPSVHPEPCEDAVSRSEIIRLILERGLYCDTQADREISAEIIRQLPSAQPDIIRCGECKYWDTTWQNDWAPNHHYCPNVDGVRRNDFYCADGERRHDAHTEA